MEDQEYQNAKEEIRRLVGKLNQVKESGRLKSYNEENTKKDFITPMFRALGWDVENRNTSDEVTNEDKISNGRVDYAFRINGIPKFFLEAKALNKGLDEIKDSEQAINYAWHKSTIWAVLTDFQKLIIYNAEVKGKTIADSQFIRLSFDQFVEQFDRLYWLSKPAFLEARLDKEALSWGKKLRKTKVGDQLLGELMGHRTVLSKNILKNNSSKRLNEHEIDEAVQRIIDRLIFIRTVEDRQIESPILRPKVREYHDKKRGKLTTVLNDIYLQFDKTYNSKLFTFNPEHLEQRHLCETLEIDNDVLADVIEGLYESKDGLIHYDFSAIDADVLGNIYEQYLSHILRKTEKRAMVESKEAHRKRQGIYYTPTYIVGYIVRNTLGELIRTKKPVEVDKIRVLDMACGSGSFLLKAFDTLDEYYRKKEKDYAQAKLDVESDSAKITRKTKILKNNIYGVDLDPKAVEIAQLNLLLKAAETKHRLPDLRENVKCGNSLIDDTSVAEARAFDWNQEFEAVVNNGGFDIIIGNPPYGATLSSIEKVYMKNKYSVAEIKINNFALFIERAIRLVKTNGYVGMIIPNSVLTYKEYKKLRRLLIQRMRIINIVNYGGGVFGDATISTMTIILKNTPPEKKNTVNVIEYPNDYAEMAKQNQFSILQSKLSEDSFNLIDHASDSFMEKLEKGKPRLGAVSKIFGGGIQTGDDKKFLANQKIDERYRITIKGKDIHRYSLTPSKWVLYDKSKLYGAGNEDVFNAPKKIVLMRCTYGLPYRLMGSIDENKCCTLKGNVTVVLLKPNISYELILALLNSKLLNYYYKKTVKNRAVTADDLEKLPIALSSSELTALIETHSKKLLELNRTLEQLKGKSTDQTTKLLGEISELDKKVNEHIYDLYGLTQEERKIVEEAVK